MTNCPKHKCPRVMRTPAMRDGMVPAVALFVCLRCAEEHERAETQRQCEDALRKANGVSDE